MCMECKLNPSLSKQLYCKKKSIYKESKVNKHKNSEVNALLKQKKGGERRRAHVRKRLPLRLRMCLRGFVKVEDQMSRWQYAPLHKEGS